MRLTSIFYISGFQRGRFSDNRPENEFFTHYDVTCGDIVVTSHGIISCWVDAPIHSRTSFLWRHVIEIYGSKIQHTQKTGDPVSLTVRPGLILDFWNRVRPFFAQPIWIEWFWDKIEKFDFREFSETVLRTFQPEHFKLVVLLAVYLNHVTSLEWLHSMYKCVYTAPSNTVWRHIYITHVTPQRVKNWFSVRLFAKRPHWNPCFTSISSKYTVFV